MSVCLIVDYDVTRKISYGNNSADETVCASNFLQLAASRLFSCLHLDFPLKRGDLAIGARFAAPMHDARLRIIADDLSASKVAASQAGFRLNAMP